MRLFSSAHCSITCAALLVLSTAQAQPSSSALSLNGTVLDPTGASIPGAIVVLKQGAALARPSVTTDMLGAFRFDSIARGSYSLEVQREGFKVFATTVKVATRSPAPLKITLLLAEVASEISVGEAESSSVSSDVTENRDAAAIGSNLFEKLPVFDQDYVAMMSAFLDPGAIGTSGTQLIVDGMEVNSVGVSPSAIQEVRINQNPYSAEFARPGRGRIEIITKAATSEYHGAFNFIFRDSHLNARDPFALVRPPEQRRIFEGFLSGPVGHGKNTGFLLSVNRQEEDLQSIVFAQGLSGPIQETVASPKRNTQIAFRLSRQFSEEHAASVQYNDRNFPGVNQGVGGFVLPEAGTNYQGWERELIFNDRIAPAPRWLNQLQFLVGRERQLTSSVSAGRKIVVQDAFTSGGAQTQLLRTENHIQGNDIVSWSAGKHFVKFGFNLPDWSRRGVDDFNNFGGTFFFSSLQDYAAQHPYAFRQQQGFGHIVYLQKEMGAFVQDEYRVRPNFSLSLGLRYNWQNYLRSNKDFAPRIAFAYAPGKSRKTVLRGGAGSFFDRTGPAPIGDVLRYNGHLLSSFLFTDPSYPDPFLGGGQGFQPTDIVRLDPTAREPYSLQYSFEVERQLAKRTTVAATYRGSVGVSLFRSRDVNAPLPPDFSVRPDPSLGVYRQIESSGRQSGNALDLTFRGELTHYFSGIAQYTLSRTINNTGGITWFPANQYDLSGEWGPADFDQRHRLNLLGSLEPGKLFGLGVGLTVASGKPYSLTTGLDPYRTGLANARPAGVSRNTLTGPGYADVDLRWSHDFYLSKAKKEKGMVTTVALDAFDLLNHVSYAAYVGNLSSPFFGHAVSALPARRLQMTVRFKF